MTSWRPSSTRSTATALLVITLLVSALGAGVLAPTSSAQESAEPPAPSSLPPEALVSSEGQIVPTPIEGSSRAGPGMAYEGTGELVDGGSGVAPPVAPGATDPLSPPAAGTESVIPPDDRTQVADTTQYPNSAIGQVNFNQGGAYICTGFFIDANTVATSGHCVHGGAGGNWSTNVQFTPGRNGTGQGSAPFGTCPATSLVTTQGWLDSADERYDYGFIQVDGCAFSDNTGWFGFFSTTDADLINDAMTIRGYPGDKPPGTMWTDDDIVRALQDEMVFYQADTSGGQSGSPVYANLPSVCGGPCAMAVHGYGHPHSTGPHLNNNHGPRITFERFVEFFAVAAVNSCPGNPFKDTPAWVELAVDFVWCNFLMSGYDDNTFRPYWSITRAQVARLLYFLNGTPPVDGYPPLAFDDVPDWVKPAVRWLVGEGFATGYPDGSFGPNRAITRAEVARMLWLMSGQPGASQPHGFTDVDPWVADAVSWLTDPGRTPQYATGYAGNLFKPDDDINRAQTTRMTCRVAGYVTC